MKKLLILFFLLIGAQTFAQYAIDAPWMENAREGRPIGESPTFQEIVQAFEAYWEDKDHKVKGSGYKPFKRWEHHWENYLKPDGTLLTAEEIWNLWEQKRSMRSSSDDADESNWQSVGPLSHTNTGSWSSGQGRVNVIEVDPNNPNTYYIGAPAGGIWKSIDAGANWEPLSDYLPQIGISAIAVDPANSDIIYIGTGDEDGADTYSVGILKSTDAGQTWQPTGLSFSNTYSSVSEIYVHPTNSTVVFAATSSGIYKSEDAGASFSLKQYGNFRDIKFKPNDPTTIYAVSQNKFYKSTDEGNSFSMVTNGLPTTAGRQVLAVTPAAPSNVYILSASNNYSFQGVYKSTNTGTSFSRVDNGADIFQSSQAYYDIAFDVSKTDENTMFVGVLDVWKSTNGGQSFTQWNSWSNPFGSSYTHADIHMIRYFGDELFFGTDGGLYKSTNGFTTSDLTEGLAIGQFYKIAVSNQSSSKMVGGLQDNGGYSYTNNGWHNFYGADGMDTAIDPANPNNIYGFVQNGGGLYYSNDGGASLAGSISGPESGNWVTPLVMNQEGELYAGYSKLYKLNGANFSQVSTSLGGFIDHLEIDPTNADIIYIALDNQLHKSTNRGATFSLAYTFPTLITSIAVNSTSNNIVYVTTSGTIGKVFKSTNSGSSFTDISYNLPAEPKLVVKHQGQHTDNPIFVGTILGVYRLDDTSTTWEVFSNNLPNVPVRDLEINLLDQNITAATYGRGIWQSSIPVQMSDNDVRLLSIAEMETAVSCEEYAPSIVVNNNGLNTITSLQIQYGLSTGLAQNFNWTGNLESEGITTIDLPAMDLPRGYHELLVTVNLANDTFSNNNSLNSGFYINDSGVTDQVNQFENPTDALVVMDANPEAPLWQRGNPGGAVLNQTGSGANAYATNPNGSYTNNTTSYLVSQCYDLTQLSEPVLNFKMAYDLEENWDIMYVEYSTDGNMWNILGSANDPNWYNSNAVPGTNCLNCPGAQWTGTNTSIQQYAYFLNEFNSETNFMVRFVFVSDEYLSHEGVVIDDLVIGEAANMSTAEHILENSISVYPNPSYDIFHLKLGSSINDVDIRVLDITGKQIFNKKNVESNHQIDLSGYSSGIYLLQIQSDQAVVVKKLIKQ